MSRRKGFMQIGLGFVRVMEERKESVITASVVLYAAFYMLMSMGGVSFLAESAWAPYSSSNTEAPQGSLWIEGGELHWADGSNERWLGTGETSVGSTGVSPLGSAWIDGTDIHFIDANGDERVYTGAATGDSPSSSGSVWLENNFIHYVDESGDERAMVVPWTEEFEDGNADGWTGGNYYVKSDKALGSYSIGSDGQGSMDAEIIPEGWSGGVKPGTLRYYWWEESSQTGFTVDFIDPNGNYVIRSGGNNPQWEVSDGTGSTQIYSGDGYQHWIKYEFNFDWANCEYSYNWEDISSGTTRTGTRSLQTCSSVETIRLSNDNSNWGGANYIRFDGFYAGAP